MMETNDAINLIDNELAARELPALLAHYGGWSIGPQLLLKRDDNVLSLWDWRNAEPISELRLPAHPRYARQFAQDLAELVPSTL